jgi:hypothetical protein
VKKTTSLYYIFFTIKFIMVKFLPKLINLTKILVLMTISNKNALASAGGDEVTMLSAFDRLF